MRYLGNKRKLLGEIERCARGLGFDRGTVCDLFAGTGVVGRHFRSLGNRVVSTDVMACSHVFQKAFLEVEAFPPLVELVDSLGLDPASAPDPATRLDRDSSLPGDARPLLAVVHHLERAIDPVEGLLTRQYSPDGEAGRRFLRPETARRLDAIIGALRSWSERELLDEPGLMLLLAATIDAADRVANISGTYGAYLKEWQTNTSQPVELRFPRLVSGPHGSANRGEALEWIGGVEADLLYIDPPYNHRQYPANYNMLDVVARTPFEADLSAFEATIYGKSGLTPWKERASPLCSQRGTECRDAFRSILRSTSIPRVVISYNEEGIITLDDFEEMLAEYAGVRRARLNGFLTEIAYPRFRSDADGRVSRTGAVRQYRTVPGREADVVREWLFHVKRRR